MIYLDGKSINKGIVCGKSVVISDSDIVVERIDITDVAAELNRISDAIDKAVEELRYLSEKAFRDIGREGAAIFEIHQMLLEDTEYFNGAADYIREEKVNAEYAVNTVGNRLRDKFLAMDDEYMRLRGEDVADVTKRLVNILSGRVQRVNGESSPAVVVAQELSPSDVVRLDKSSVLGFVIKRSALNSHVAILARMMNVPAIIVEGLDISAISSGMTVLVNGYDETVIFEPDNQALDYAEKIRRREIQYAEFLDSLKGKANITKDGRKIDIYANISGTEDIDDVKGNDAGGIGLFRSEFLYLGRDYFPSEDEQYRAYRTVAKAMDGKSVVIRTMDLGADKYEDYLGLDREENPALGYRGIRISLRRPEILKTQLRALLRAAVYGNIKIIYPMVVSTDEIMKIKAVMDETIKELDSEGYTYRVPDQGVMIETPAAALISDEIAELVDFVSIGTNDLTQYTLAMDRQNAMLDNIFDPKHKAILKLIKIVADNAHKAGIRVGICGELAADVELTEEFINMGIDVLSVAPPMVLKVREKVLSI